MMKWCKRGIGFVTACIMLVTLTAYPVCAEVYHFDGNTGWTDGLFEELPTEIQEELENDGTAEAIGEVLRDKLQVSYWLSRLLDGFSDVFLPSLKTASAIFGMLLLTASVNLLSENLLNSSFNGMFELCGNVCVASAVLGTAESMITLSSAYLDRLCSVMNVMIPVTEAICLTEASLTQFTVHKAAMLLYITVTSNLNNLILKPLFGVLFGFAAVGSVFQQFGLSGFIGGIRKFVMTVISLFTMIFSFILGLQTVLAKSADSLGLKTVRLALGSFVPIVGGTLSEALTTVREGIGVIKSAAGVGGVVIIMMMVLPVTVSLFSGNMILSFCHMTAEMLGCGSSARMIQDIKSVLSILCAVVYATSLLFVMAMILFAKAGSGG